MAEPNRLSVLGTSMPSPTSSSRRMSFTALNNFRRKSISELSAVFDIIRGIDGPTSSLASHPDRSNSPTSSDQEHRNLTPPGVVSVGVSRHRNRRRNALWKTMNPHHIQRRFVIVQEEKAMQSAPTAPIDATKFVAYVTERRKKRILFKGEYLVILRSVDPLRCQCNVASSQGDCNQYPDTLPYDHSRVVLSTKSDDENSHYTNASYVPSWFREKAYVVTQAVKSKPACEEFWRMVYELRTNTIVMLTKVFDFMRVMCLQYWPTGEFSFKEIHVETLETKTYAHFVIRTFRLRHSSEGSGGRIIKHFHFTEWELNSFPYISAFIELRRRVRQWTDAHPVDAPTVVHCSNGAGRSGAYLALDANLDLLKRTGQIDVFEYAKIMIQARPNLIDSVDQYIFIYKALSEAVLCNIGPIAMHELKNRSSMYLARRDRQKMEIQDSHENKLLFMLTPVLRIGDCAGGHRIENRGKNRDVMVVPPDHARPYLQTLHGESKDYTYINAVSVDGFTRKAEFIVTEWPKQQTIDSFWTLIFDHAIHTVVNLTNPQNSKMYPTFIHNKGKQNYGPFVVEVLNYQQYPGMTSHMVKIQKRSAEDMNEREPSTLDKILGRTPMVVRRPTLSGFFSAETEMETKERHDRRWNRNCPPGQFLRFKPIYSGKIRSRFNNAVFDSSEPRQSNILRQISNASQVLQKGGTKVANLARSASRLARDLATRSRSNGKVRKFTAPSSKTLKTFEKTFMISEIMATGASQQQMEAEVRICCIIQVRVWPIENKVPLSTASLIEVIKMMRLWRRRAPDRPETKPTVIMSHNGYSRCGIFIGANVCIDQMDMDREVDVFHAVKMIRINRPQLIDMKDEYKYLYDLMLHWYMTNTEYRIHDVDDVVEDTNGNDTHLTNGSAFSTNRSSLKSVRRPSGSPLKRSIGPELPAAPLPLTNHI